MIQILLLATIALFAWVDLCQKHTRWNWRIRLFVLRRSDQVIEPRKQWPPNALVTYGWRGRIRAELQAEAGRAPRYGVMRAGRAGQARQISGRLL